MIAFLITILLNVSSASPQTWTAVADNDAQNLCPGEVFTQVEDNTFTIATLDPMTSRLYSQFRNINQGRECWEKNSSNIFGGMYCADTSFDGLTYTNVKCQTSFASFTCTPNANDKDHTVTTVTVGETVVSYVERSYDDLENKIVERACSYVAK